MEHEKQMIYGRVEDTWYLVEQKSGGSCTKTKESGTSIYLKIDFQSPRLLLVKLESDRDSDYYYVVPTKLMNNKNIDNLQVVKWTTHYSSGHQTFRTQVNETTYIIQKEEPRPDMYLKHMCRRLEQQNTAQNNYTLQICSTPGQLYCMPTAAQLTAKDQTDLLFMYGLTYQEKGYWEFEWCEVFDEQTDMPVLEQKVKSTHETKKKGIFLGLEEERVELDIPKFEPKLKSTSDKQVQDTMQMYIRQVLFPPLWTAWKLNKTQHHNAVASVHLYQSTYVHPVHTTKYCLMFTAEWSLKPLSEDWSRSSS